MSKFLLGRLKDGEFAFGEMRVEKRNGRENEFGASFFTVRPFKVEDVDKEELLESWFGPDDFTDYDSDEKYKLCVKYHCNPFELPGEIAAESSIEDLIDCSLYNNRISVDGEDWMFESSCAGQHIMKLDDFEKCISPGGFNALMQLHENYHLKDLPKYLLDEPKKIEELFFPAYSSYAEWFIEECLKEEE